MGVVPAGIIFMWPGTAGTIPAGYSCHVSLSARYPRASSTAGGTGGGIDHTHSVTNHTHTQDEHDHDITLASTIPAGKTHFWDTPVYSADRNVTHGHPGTTPGVVATNQTTPVTLNSKSNLPESYVVIFIESDGTEAVPDGACVLHTLEVLKTGWIAHAAALNRYLRGAGGAGGGGGTLGSAGHTHEEDTPYHTHVQDAHGADVFDSGIGFYDSNINNVGATNLSEGTHRHEVTTQAATPTNDVEQVLTLTNPNDPAYVLLGMAKNDTGGGDMLLGMIGLWGGAEADIPMGWTKCDGSEDTPDLTGDQLPKVSATFADYGDTGGVTAHANTVSGHTHTSPIHTHSVSSDTGGTNPLESTGAVGSRAAPHSHTTTCESVSITNQATTVTIAEASSFPLYTDYIFIMFTGVVTSIASHAHQDSGVVHLAYVKEDELQCASGQLDLNSPSVGDLDVVTVASVTASVGVVDILEDGEILIHATSEDDEIVRHVSPDYGESWS